MYNAEFAAHFLHLYGLLTKIYKLMSILKHIIVILLLAGSFINKASCSYAYEYKISSKDKAIFKSAYSKARNNQFDAAMSEASQASDKTILKLIKWLGYQDGYARGGYDEIASFIERNPSWPSIKILKNKAEFSLTGRESNQEVLKSFKSSPPVTGYGMKLLAEARIQSGDNSPETVNLLRQAWRQGDFSREDEEKFLSEHSKVLTQDDHFKRVDRMLWEGEESDAKRLYPLLNDNQKRIVQVRLELMENNPGAIAKITEPLRSDPGLIYEQVRIYSERESFGRVYQMLYPVVGTMPSQAKWWKIKNRLIRELLDQNKIKEAYYIAKNHGNEQTSSDYADAEWLAGWISLRYLNNPQESYKHFYNMYNRVEFPVSLSRAAYWAGRAAESNRNPDIAKSWYEVSAAYVTSFYGQLSYLKIHGNKASLNLPPNPTMGLSAKNTDKVRELLMSAYILESVGQSGMAERFMKAAIDSVDTAAEMAYICEFGIKIGRPNFSVVAAKQALTDGEILPKHGWPNTKYMPKSISVEEPFALSIIRQESVFNPHALSSAKAMGLMQLIPATASRMAKGLGIAYSPNKLLTHPEYNITLGSYYLNSLVENFDGSYILAIASYNAGPGNVRKWNRKYLDPRQMDNVDDVIDWIESIPFNETRNYVQRVLENLQVYRSRVADNKLTLMDDLMRGTKK